MCNLSWTPHSNLEKDNSLKTTPVLAQRWAVWSIHNYELRTKSLLNRLSLADQFFRLPLCLQITIVIDVRSSEGMFVSFSEERRTPTGTGEESRVH